MRTTYVEMIKIDLDQINAVHGERPRFLVLGVQQYAHLKQEFFNKLNRNNCEPDMVQGLTVVRSRSESHFEYGY